MYGILPIESLMYCVYNASPTVGTPQTKPSAVEVHPTTSETVRVNQTLAPSRATWGLIVPSLGCSARCRDN